MNRRSFIHRFVAAAGLGTLVGRLSAKTDWKPVLGSGDHYTILRDPSVEAQGLVVKVPSNRHYHEDREAIMREGYRSPHYGFYYVGTWDGTFKLESGCTNPAYVLADLHERLGKGKDWVLCYTLTDTDEGRTYVDDRLGWPMLYDWGRWHDDTLAHEGEMPYEDVIRVAKDPEDLYQHLRMLCLAWQSSHPRYRTSLPGIPYDQV